MAPTETKGAIEDSTGLSSRRRQIASRALQHQSSPPSDSSLPRQVIVIKSNATSNKDTGSGVLFYLCPLVSLVAFWVVLLVIMVDVAEVHPDSNGPVSGVHRVVHTARSALRRDETIVERRDYEFHNPKIRPSVMRGMMKKYQLGLQQEERHQILEQQQEQQTKTQKESSVSSKVVSSQAHIVSRIPHNVVATADVRGNLGPATVVVQAKPGTDWIHDRWQAASNMHGKQIPGEHWVQLEFKESSVVADKVVLDWETAYADEYILEASLEPITDETATTDKVWILFDGRNSQDVGSMRSVTESGKSPGVKEPRPLHVVHEIQLDKGGNSHGSNRHKPFRFLRLHILKSVTGWGVSLWQFDVYGFLENELKTSR